MDRTPQEISNLGTRFFYGSMVGAMLGMLIGSMPGNDGVLALIAMATCAAVVGILAVVSLNFWESLRAAWELLRVSFWRW
jgi:hypothetical protein